MEDIFNMLSSSARIDKSKRTKKNKKRRHHHHHHHHLNDDTTMDATVVEEEERVPTTTLDHDNHHNDSSDDSDDDDNNYDDDLCKATGKSRDRTGKRDTSEAKQRQVHRERIAAFRRSMAIRLANKHDPDIPDPISSFHEVTCPAWWADTATTTTTISSFQSFWRPMLGNIEAGRWKEPTPIQMQSIPALLNRRDYIGAAPTGSGKSGAFLLPLLLLSSAPYEKFYGVEHTASIESGGTDKKKKAKKKDKKKKDHHTGTSATTSREGEIRSLVVAPTLELASQLHREVERLGLGKPGGVSSLLLSKSNASNVLSGSAGGKHGLDVMVTTPLRLVDSIEKGLKLDAVRMIVMDEADRLLDAADGSVSTMSKQQQQQHESKLKESDDGDEENSDSDEDTDKKQRHPKKKRKQHSKRNPGPDTTQQSSGSSQTKSFLAQMDIILSHIPQTAVRALFSATVTPIVRSLAESALRNPVDAMIAAPGTDGGANSDIDQQLMFVGKEEGKLLAMRQLAKRGQLKPPVIVFTQSQERAQALFAELLYDGLHCDIIHAGRSKAARDNAVAKFRRGDTWVLICTDLVSRGVDFKSINMVINYDLPASGINYVHRIGRTGRAGRKGVAITLFTEADFENLRTIANVMKQSGCKVEDWMLNLKRNNRKDKKNPRRYRIDTTPRKRRKRERGAEGAEGEQGGEE